MVRLPKVIIHEPVWWDQGTGVDHPGTSYGKMLNVPLLNWRGKMDAEDLVRFYPKEWDADQAMLRMRQLERRKNRRSAARLHGCSQKAKEARSQATPTTPTRSASATPTSPPHSLYFL
jgi:hypothetical protein